MGDVKIELNSDGVRALLRSPGVQADLDARARRISAAAGPGMLPTVEAGKTRARASVITASDEARRAEATGRALTRAVDAGR